MFNKINVGTEPNSGNGDLLRDAFIKINSNLDQTYTKEEVNDLIEDVEVDLSNYDTKSEVDAKIVDATSDLASKSYVNNAVTGINLPTKTSDLINDGNGVVGKPFITVDDIPGLSNTIDQVLQAGNTSDREMRLGNIRINVNTLLYPLQIVNSSEQPAHRWGDNGNYLASNAVRIAPPGEGLVELGKFSSGVLVVNNVNNNRSSKVFFDSVVNNAEIRFRNISGTVALLSEIPSIAGLIPEAPMDGDIYGRSAGTWVPISGGGGPLDPTNQNVAKDGVGYKLYGRTFTNVTLGLNSLFWGTSISSGGNYTSGADSVAFGENQRPEGTRSFISGSGNRTRNSATNAVALGANIDLLGNSSIGLGFDLKGSAKVGQVLVGAYSKLSNETTTQQFIVGIGTSGNRQHGLEVLDLANKGFVKAPYQKAIDMFNDVDDTILVHKSYVEFYYTPRIAFDDLEDRVEVLESNNLTPANFINMLNNATPTQIDEIKTLLGIS